MKQDPTIAPWIPTETRLPGYEDARRNGGYVLAREKSGGEVSQVWSYVTTAHYSHWRRLNSRRGRLRKQRS